MNEKEIKFNVGCGMHVMLRFVLEDGLWVCRVSDECINDLASISEFENARTN